MLPSSLFSSIAYSGGFIERNILPFNLKSYGFDTSTFPFCNIEWPLFFLILYALIFLKFQPSVAQEIENRRKKKKQNSNVFSISTVVICLHNILLCIFSGMCFYHLYSHVFHWVSMGWQTAVCDGHISRAYSMDHGYGYYVFLMYLSRYYEFVDTWIVIWKGRRPMFLQKFHHMSICVAVWIIICSKACYPFGFLLNAFVHTVMYAYYALSVWKIRVPFKFMITVLQLVQFITGLVFGYHNLSYSCLTVADRASLRINMVFIVMLFALFAHFFWKRYLSQKEKKK